MATENIDLGIKMSADIKDIKTALKSVSAMSTELSAGFKQLSKDLNALNQSMNANISKMANVKAEANKLNKERQQAYLTNKRLMSSETLLGAIYTKNSAVAQKKYLNSITGLRKALSRFRDETSRVMIVERGHISMLDEQSNAMKRFMIQANLTSRTLDNMATKYLNLGKNLQWTGRQLMVGLTMPIAAAGFGAVRSYLAWDKAITRTTKLLEEETDTVTGATKSVQELSNELQKAATAMSEKYGAARESIMGDTMAIFAQIGAGRKEIELLSNMSVEFNMLGDLDDMATASEMVRVVFQGFRAETGNVNAALRQTSDTLKVFNLIEDETSLSMAGIAEAVPKVSNTLKSMGVGLGEGIAFLSAMTQNGISATESANALRFALNKLPAAGAYLEDPRLQGQGRARLKELTDAIERYNATATTANRIDLFDQGGRFKGADQAILQIGKAWTTMDDQMRATFSRALAGANQLERLGTLFTNVGASINGNQAQDFFKAFNAANDQGLADARWEEQLKMILESPAYRWQQTLQQLRNSIQDLGQEISNEILPVAEKFAGWLRDAVTWFKELDPATRKWLIGLTGFAAIVGPITYGLGQLVILSAQLVKTGFTKPLKALFALKETVSDMFVGSKNLGGQIDEVWNKFESGDINRNQLKRGIEEAIEAQVRLRNETNLTTADLKRQGLVNVAPVGMEGAPVVGPQGRGGFRGRLRGILSGAGRASVDDLKPTQNPFGRDPVTYNWTLDEMERLAPQILREAVNDELTRQNLLGIRAGAGVGPVTAADAKKRLGVTKKDVPYPLIPGMQSQARLLDVRLGDVDKRLEILNSPEYLEEVEQMYRPLQDAGKTAAEQARMLRGLRGDYQKIVSVMVRETGLTTNQISDRAFMDNLIRKVKKNITQTSYLGNPIMSEKNIIEAISRTLDSDSSLPGNLYPRDSVGTLRTGTKFLERINRQGVVTDTNPERGIGVGRSSSIATGRNLTELLGFRYFPSQVRDIYSKLNRDLLDKEILSELDFDANSIKKMIQRGFAENKTGEVIAEEIVNTIYPEPKKLTDSAREKYTKKREEILRGLKAVTGGDKDIEDFIQSNFIDTNKRSRKVRDKFKSPIDVGKNTTASLMAEWREAGLGAQRTVASQLSEMFSGTIPGSEASFDIPKGAFVGLSDELMEIVVSRTTEGRPNSGRYRDKKTGEIVESGALNKIKEYLRGEQEQELRLLQEFDEIMTEEYYGIADGDNSDSNRAKIAERARDRRKYVTERMGAVPSEMLRSFDIQTGKSSIIRMLDELGDQVLEKRIIDAGGTEAEVKGALARIRSLRALKDSPMINSISQVGFGSADFGDIESNTLLQSLFQFFDEGDRERAVQDVFDEKIAAYDAQIKKLDTRRKSGFAQFSKSVKSKITKEIEDATKLRDMLVSQRSRVTSALQVARFQGRTGVEFLPNGTELTDQIIDDFMRTGFADRQEANDRVLEAANAKLTKQMAELRQKGIDDRFDKNVRAKLAGQINDPSYKGRQFAKALFSAGMFGRFNGSMDQGELRARAMLLERNMNMGQEDRPITRREIAAQRGLIAQGDASGGMPSVLMPNSEASKGGRERIGDKIKDIGTKSRQAAGSAKDLVKPKGLLNAATWLQPANAIKGASGSIAAFAAQSKTIGRFATAGKGLAPVFDVMTMGLGSVGVQAATSLTALGPLIPVIALLAGIGLLLWKNWDKVSEGIGGGLKALKDGFMGIVDAVIGPFKNMFSDLSSDGDDMASMWENIGNIINVVAHAIGLALDAVATAIRPIMQMLADVTRVVIDMVRLVVAVLAGDWKAAWHAARDLVGSVVIAVGNAVMLLPAMIVDAIGGMVGFLADIVDKIPGAGKIKDQINDVADAIDGAAESIRNAPKDIGGFLRGDKKGAEEAADEEIKAHSRGWANADAPKTPGPEANTDVAEEAANDEVGAFINAFQGQLRKVVDGWKQSALDAYDQWADAQQEAIEQQIKSLNDLTKAEEEALRDREYLRRREEMMNNMRNNRNKYQFERDKLIAEGKYDEASELDSQYAIEKADQDRDMADMEEDRQRELTLRERDGQIARLEQQKDDNQKKFDLQKEALQKQLDVITEYIPKNAGEAAKMQQAILGAMETFLPGYGGMATAAQEAWRGSWNSAWGATTKQVAEDSFWAGREALTQFAKGLGVDVAGAGLAGFEGVSGGAGGRMSPRAIEGSLGEDIARGNTTVTAGTGRRYGPTGSVFHTGGNVGNTSMSPSDVPATLQTGEFVVQRKAVAKYGQNFLQTINEGKHAGGNVFHTGGLVGKAFTKLAKKSIDNFFAGGGALGGGLTWEGVQGAWRNALGGMMGMGPGFFAQNEDPGDFIKSWVKGNVTGVNKSFVERFAKYAQALGRPLQVTSGYRSTETQRRLWNGGRNPLAAPPGRSWHEKGLAIDHAPHSTPAWRRMAEERFGLYYPMASLTSAGPRRKGGLYEAWHVQPKETMGKSASAYKYGEVPEGMMSDDGGIPPAAQGNVALIQDIVDKLRGTMSSISGSIPTGTAQEMAMKMLSQWGWNESQWGPLNNLVTRESSWRVNAANPTSSARGLFQFLKSTWANHISSKGGPAYWNQDPYWQIRGGFDYIKGRYGSPSGAWDFWQRNKWYHEGGLAQLMDGGNVLREGVAKIHAKETVLTAPLSEDLKRGIQNMNSGGGGDGIHLHIGQFFGTDREIEKLGKEIERVMAKTQRARGFETRSFKTR